MLLYWTGMEKIIIYAHQSFLCQGFLDIWWIAEQLELWLYLFGLVQFLAIFYGNPTDYNPCFDRDVWKFPATRNSFVLGYGLWSCWLYGLAFKRLFMINPPFFVFSWVLGIDQRPQHHQFCCYSFVPHSLGLKILFSCVSKISMKMSFHGQIWAIVFLYM